MTTMALAAEIVGRRHRDHASALGSLVEGLEQGNAEHDRLAFSKGLLPGIKFEWDLRHVVDAVLVGELVGLRIGLLEDEPIIEGPDLFVAGAELGEAFHRQLDDAALVLVLRPVTPAGIIVHKEPADVDVPAGRLLDPVLVRTRDCVRDTGIGVALVLDQRHGRAQVNGLRQRPHLHRHRRLVLRRASTRCHGLVAGGLAGGD